MNLQEIRKHFQHYNLKAVSKEIGMDYYVLRNIINGITENPSYRNFEKLSDYVNSKQVKS